MASRTGAMARQNIVDTYLGRAGLGTHGDGSGRRVSSMHAGVFGDPTPVQLGTFGDLCDSTGSSVASFLHAAGASGDGSLTSTLQSSTTDSGAQSAIGVGGALLNAVGSMWGQQCTVEAARQQSSQLTSSGNSQSQSDMTTAFQQSISTAITQSQQSQQQATAAALAQQQATNAAAQTRTLLIAGGIGLGALVLLGGAFLLLK